MKASSSFPLSAKLNCEQLESRANPSNLSVGYSGGTLTISGAGDTSANIFTLVENSQGNYYVVAGQNTLLNGSSFVMLGEIRPTNIVINDGNGGNHIAVYGVHGPEHLSITTGFGGNYVNLAGDATDYISVIERGGNNTLITSSDISYVGSTLLAGNGYNVWIDNGLYYDQYLNQSGWSEIT